MYSTCFEFITSGNVLIAGLKERFALYNSHASSAQEGSIHVAVLDTICTGKYYSAAVYHYVHFKYMYIF